jgi:hypothetical protein
MTTKTKSAAANSQVLSIEDCNDWMKKTYRDRYQELSKLGLVVSVVDMFPDTASSTKPFSKDVTIRVDGSTKNFSVWFCAADYCCIRLDETTLEKLQRLARGFWKCFGSNLLPLYVARNSYLQGNGGLDLFDCDLDIGTRWQNSQSVWVVAGFLTVATFHKHSFITKRICSDLTSVYKAVGQEDFGVQLLGNLFESRTTLSINDWVEPVLKSELDGLYLEIGIQSDSRSLPALYKSVIPWNRVESEIGVSKSLFELTNSTYGYVNVLNLLGAANAESHAIETPEYGFEAAS